MLIFVLFFFFKQKTAYEMRISDWSSDGCSSDLSVSDNGATDTLIHLLGRDAIEARMRAAGHSDPSRNIPFLTTVEAFALKGNNFADLQIGRASCRERVCQYV